MASAALVTIMQQQQVAFCIPLWLNFCRKPPLLPCNRHQTEGSTGLGNGPACSASCTFAVGLKVCSRLNVDNVSANHGWKNMYKSLSSNTCKRQKLLHNTCRLYIADDVEYVEQDLEQLRVLFLADGQGLPAQDIEDLCTPVVDLLNVLQLETGILIKNFKDVCFQDFSYSRQLVFCCCALSWSCCCNHDCTFSSSIFVLQSCLVLCCGRFIVNTRVNSHTSS